MPGLIAWPRRSEALPSNRITASSAPCGMFGNVTASSEVFGPDGLSLRNQISRTGLPPFVTLVPSACSIFAIAGGRSDGGAPAGSALYCAKAVDEHNRTGMSSERCLITLHGTGSNAALHIRRLICCTLQFQGALTMSKRTFSVVTLAAISLVSCSKKDGVIEAGPDFEKRLQTALIEAKAGSVIELPESRFDMTGTLSLTVPNVTVRGKGIGKTVLSYKNQKTGAAGILATGNSFTLEDLSIEDTKGDGVKINSADGVTIRRVRAEWTGGPNEKNGSYGIYPVQCKNVLIEDSASIGAADAGIYVGQSKNIIVRRNRAEYNVAGIEIENSEAADVYDNVATNNAGGLLVFALPDLPVKASNNTR